MKNLILNVLSSLGFEKKETSAEHALKVYNGKFAFCGASGAEPTGRMIEVQGRKFREGRSVCPVMN